MSFSWFRNWPSKKSEFSQYSDDFYLSQDGILVKKDIPKDDQAVIDSYFSSRLEALLDQYSDVVEGLNGYKFEFSDDVIDIDLKKKDLDKILAVDQIVDEFKMSDAKYADFTREQVIAQLQKSYDEAVAAYMSKINSDGGNTDAQTEKTVEEGE